MARSSLRGQATGNRGQRPVRRAPSRRKARFGLRPRLEAPERRDLLASYTTPEDTLLTVTDQTIVGAVLIAPAAHGKVEFTATGGFAYSPALNYNGPDAFVYRLGNSTTPNTQNVTAAITV